MAPRPDDRPDQRPDLRPDDRPDRRRTRPVPRVASATEPRPPRLSLHEARQRLEHERNARLTQLRTVSAAADDEDAHDPAGPGADRHVVSAQREVIQRVLDEIDEAFARVRDGRYGICLGCDGPVPAERLEILPYTRWCVGCRRRTT